MLLMNVPKSRTRWKDTNDVAHPLRFGVQYSVPQNTADVFSCHIFIDIKKDQTITIMTQALIVKIAVEREECWPVQLMQQGNDFAVLHPLSPKFLADLSQGDTTAPQQSALTLRDVFIQNVHAGKGSRAYSAA